MIRMVSGMFGCDRQIGADTGKRSLLIALAITAIAVVSAVILCDAEDSSAESESFTVDNITYYVISDTEVEIVSNSCSGFVAIPSSVTYSGKYYSVTTITGSAFNGNESLTSVYIPDSVTTIYSGAFGNCTSVTEYTVDSENTAYCSDDGVLFNKEKTELVQYPIGSANTSYTIPGSVTSIGDYLFRECSSLISVTIGDGVTSIGTGAFNKCVSLTSVSIPGSVKTIGEHAFNNCESLTSVSIPDSVTSIKWCTFSGCTSLASVSIPGSVTSIEGNAFSNCESLTSVSIPGSVTSIGEYAFFKCESLASVSIPDGVTSIEKYVFCGCESLASVSIPGSVTSIEEYSFSKCTSLASVSIPGSITSIGNDAFYGCSALGSVVIPNSVTSLGKSAFLECKSLISATISENITVIYGFTFCGCESLTSVSIPDSVTYIGEYAFSECKSLTSATVGENVEYIGAHTFSRCTSLTSVSIPDSVTSIGYYAFFNCASVTAFTVGDGNSKYCSENGVLFNKEKTTLIQYPAGTTNSIYVIPDSVTTISDSAFFVCRSLTSVSIPDGVRSIGDSAFYECTSLTSIVIPNGVKSISNYVFDGCESLTSVTIPDSVTSIGEYAFFNCGSLASIYIPDGVTSIGKSAFYRCTSLTSILIPDGVTSIGDSAFSRCTSLTSIVIPDGVTSIGEYTFWECTSLTSVSIPNSVASIGTFAFEECVSLTSVTIPSSVKTIGSYAFARCTSMTSAIISDGVKSIRDHAFYSCTSLTSVVIPNSVTSIGESSFEWCWSVTFISISDNVLTIDEDAFSLGWYKHDVTCYVCGCSEGKLTSDKYTKFIYCYMITYDVDGGSVPMQSDIIVMHEEYCLKGYAGTKDGFVFGGWSDGTSRYDVGTIVTVSKDTTFKAVWIGLYTVTVDPEEGTVKSAPADWKYDEVRKVYTKSVLDGDSIDSPEFIIEKAPDMRYIYTQNGWSYKDGTAVVFPLTVSSEITLYVSYDKEIYRYMITYDVDGGSVPMEPDFTPIHEKYCLKGYTGTKDGFVFGGWSDGTSRYDVGTIVTVSKDTTFKAVWTGLYTVTVDPEEGTVKSVPADWKYDEARKVYTKSVVDGDSIDSPEFIIEKSPEVKYVYIQNGWSYKDGTAAVFPLTVSSEVTLYVSYDEAIRCYDVVYRSDEWSKTEFLEYGSIIVPIDGPEKKPSSSYTYVFYGWDGFIEGMRVTGNTSFNAIYDTYPIIPDKNDIMYEVNTHLKFTDDNISELKTKAKDADVSLTVKTDAGTVKFDRAAIRSFEEGACLYVIKISNDSFVSSVSGEIGDSPIYEISFGKNSHFGDGSATVVLPYVQKSGNDPGNLKIYCFENGQLTGKLDCISTDNKVSFSAGSLSAFAVVDETPVESSDSGVNIWLIVGGIAAGIAVIAVIAAVVIKRR